MDKSKQSQAREVFDREAKRFGRWDPAVLWGLLGDELHRACGFRGSLRSVQDLDALTDDQADCLCRLLPSLIDDLPDLAV